MSCMCRNYKITPLRSLTALIWCIYFFNIVLYIPSQCGLSVPVCLSLISISFPQWHTHTYTHKVFWEDVQLPWLEWLMTPFTAQTPHNQRCWGSVSARCPVWVITPGTQLIYYPTISPAVRTCCSLQCPCVPVQGWECEFFGSSVCLFIYFFLLLLFCRAIR